MHWIYTALDRWGEEITGDISGSKKDVLEKLAGQNIEIIQIAPNYKKMLKFTNRMMSTRSMASLFNDFHNMMETGMSLLQILSILRETSHDETLTQALLTMEQNLRQGKSLTETFIELKSFPWVVSVALSAGEKAGKLSQVVGSLGAYFQYSSELRAKVKQALVYPLILFFILVSLMLFVSLKIVPQLKDLLPQGALTNQMTQWVLAISLFFQNYLFYLSAFLIVLIACAYYFAKKNSQSYQEWIYRWPMIGSVFKESALALYLLNLSVLLRSGVPLLRGISELNTLDQTPVAHHFQKVRDYVLGGSSFWQSIEHDNFFPKIIPSTLRRAEEMTQIDQYCFSLSEYFQKKLNNRIDGLVHIIQPALLLVGGMFLVVIAVAFLFPIYSSLITIAGGQ